MSAFRLYLFEPIPGAEAIVATARVELGEPAEERPRPREVILSVPAAEPRRVLDRLVGTLDELHPCWRTLIELAPTAGRAP